MLQCNTSHVYVACFVNVFRGRPLLITFKWMYKTYTFSDPSPPQKVYTSTFFKWIVCHENDKNGLTRWKCMESTFFFLLNPLPLKEYVLYTWFNIDKYGSHLNITVKLFLNKETFWDASNIFHIWYNNLFIIMMTTFSLISRALDKTLITFELWELSTVMLACVSMSVKIYGRSLILQM